MWLPALDLGLEDARVNRPAAAAAAALLMLATACSGDAADTAPEPAAAEQSPSSAPPASGPLEREDTLGQSVCDDALEKLTILGAVDDEWDNEQWFEWWDDAYRLGDMATLARTKEIQDSGRALRDADPADMAAEMVMMALTCVEHDFLTAEQFQDHVAEVIDLDGES